MKTRRALVVTKKIFWSLGHDKRSLALILLAPILAMLLFGLAFSGEVEDVPVLVVNEDRGFEMNNTTFSLSEVIVENFDTDVLDVEYTDDPEAALERVKSGEIYAVIHFPEDLTRDVILAEGNDTYRGNDTIRIRADKSNVNVASAVTKAVNQALYESMEELGREPPLTVVADKAVYAENAEFIDFFVPGIIGFAVFMLTTILTLVTFVGEKTRGTLQRLLATPVTEGEIVVGYAVAFSVTGMVQVGILMGLAILAFDIMVVGNPLLAFLIASMLAVVSISLGILLSSAAHRESQAIQFLPLVILPTFLLSGIFWPLEAIPSWLRPTSYFIPVTYAVKALRSVLLRGWGLGGIWVELLTLFGFTVLFLAGAVMTLRRSRRE